MTNERLIEYLKLAKKDNGENAFDDEKINSILANEDILNFYKTQFENYEAFFLKNNGESYDLLENLKKRRK